MRSTFVFAVVLVLALLTWTSIQGFPANPNSAAEENNPQLSLPSGTTACSNCNSAWNNRGMGDRFRLLKMRPTYVFAVVLVLLTWTSIQGLPVKLDTAMEEKHVINKRQVLGGSDTTICYTCAFNNPGMSNG